MATLSITALCTLRDVKEFLGIKGSDSDGTITSLINRVSSDCQDRFCRRKFLKATYDEKYDGDGTQVLYLRNRPIASVSTLVVAENGSDISAQTEEYYVYPEAGKIRLRHLVFEEGYQNVHVVYDAGYDGLANLPETLRLSVIEAVAFRYEEADKRRVGVASVSMGDQRQDYITDEYPSHVIEVWQSFARRDYA